MAEIQVSNVVSTNGTVDLLIKSANTNAGEISLHANGLVRIEPDQTSPTTYINMHSGGIIDVTSAANVDFNVGREINGINTYRPAGYLNPFKNLQVDRASTTTVDIDADHVWLFTDNSKAKKFSTINETVNITTTGAGGLQSGLTEASATWYYIWLIGNDTGTIDPMLNTSATSITLPAGYTHYGLVGAVYNDLSSHLLDFHQRDFTVSIDAQTLALGSSGTTWTSLTNTVYVAPPEAVKILLRQYGTCTTINANRTIFFGTESSEVDVIFRSVFHAGTTNGGSGGSGWIPYRGDQNLYYKVNVSDVDATIEGIGYSWR